MCRAAIHALEEVMRADNQILLATQKDPNHDDPDPDAIFSIGTLATVLQLLKLPDGTVKVLVEGGARARVSRFIDNENFFEAAVEMLGAKNDINKMTTAVIRRFFISFSEKVYLGITEEYLADRNKRS